MLKKLAEVAESCRLKANNNPSPPGRRLIQFAKAGERVKPSHQSGRGGLLSSSNGWALRVDLGKQLQFPREIVETSLRPDLVMWSEVSKTVLLVELTVPWEGGVEAANERKRAKYADLVAECREAGWRTIMWPVEVG